MKKAIILILALCIISDSYSLISTNLQEYSKGETISVSISELLPNQSFNLQIKINEILLHEQELIADSLGNYNYNYQTSLIQPSGDWQIIIPNESLSIKVNPTAQSSTLLITFISPINFGNYQRSNNVSIKAKVLQNLMEITDATAYAYLNNEIINLTFKEGFYTADYKMPYNASLKDYELIITAQKGSIAGENKINITVSKVPIIIEIIEPKLAEIISGETIQIYFKANYLGNEALQKPKIKLLIENKSINITTTNGIDFYSNYKITDIDGQTLDILLEINDDANNSAKESLTIAIKGQEFYLINEYKYYLISLAVILSIISYFIFKHFSKKSLGNSLENSKKEIKELQKKVQQDYYIKGSIDESEYESLMSDYEEKLTIINEKLKESKIKKPKK